MSMAMIIRGRCRRLKIKQKRNTMPVWRPSRGFQAMERPRQKLQASCSGLNSGCRMWAFRRFQIPLGGPAGTGGGMNGSEGSVMGEVVETKVRQGARSMSIIDEQGRRSRFHSPAHGDEGLAEPLFHLRSGQVRAEAAGIILATPQGILVQIRVHQDAELGGFRQIAEIAAESI